MQGKTHRVGGMLCCLGGYTLLQSRGMLLGDVSPMVQLAVMYPFAIYGSVVSDLDHNWHSAPSKDVISLGVNKLLHLTTPIAEKTGNESFFVSLFNAKHRSWQTHSDLFLVLMILGSNWLLSGNVTSADQVIIRLITVGLVLGIMSHLILDMLTPEGVWSVVTTTLSKVTKYRKIPRKISFVPNTAFFRTGGTWETIIRSVMWVLCIILALNIALSFSPYEISISGIWG